jgi:hypothetical protein
MSARNKFNFLSTAALSVLAIALTVAPANALPGQNINTVLKWAKTRPQLSALKYNSEAHGYEGRNGNLYFYVNATSQNGAVTKEGITVSDDPSIKFTTNNAKGMKLLQNIYNSEIANDFVILVLSPKSVETTFIAGKNLPTLLLRFRMGLICR